MTAKSKNGGLKKADIKPKFNFMCSIHTCQMRANNVDIDSETIEKLNNKPYIIKPKVRQTNRGYLFPINPNKLYDTKIENLMDFFTSIEIIREDLHMEQWALNRADFAFDTELKYDDLYKKSLYFICLLSKITGIKNAIDIADINTKEKRALTLKSPFFEFQIYDKALESKNKQPCCRFEFRFKNIDKCDFYSIIAHLKTLFNKLPTAIGTLEKQRICDLYALWEREKKAVGVAQTKSFSEFVRRHSNDIFTRNIAKGLHAKICNGDFNNWLGTFRRSSQLSFITKSDIQDMVKDLKNALNIYI